MCNCRSEETQWNYGSCPECHSKRFPKPHKHAAVIKAWVDGASIQTRCKPILFDWIDVSCPRWLPSWEYRIKPEPKPDVVKYGALTIRNDYVYVDICFSDTNAYVGNNLKLTFDGETGQLKAVSLL